MNLKKHIPNLFTLGNLLCGMLAVMAAVNKYYEAVAILVFVGIFFDFLDGFLARILNVQGELGKQLDSLADMVTSGVVPGLVMFKFYEDAYNSSQIESDLVMYLVFLSFLLTLSAAYRLAKFNIDTRQSESFIGMPTPAMSLFVVFLPIISAYSDIEFVKEFVGNNYVLIGVIVGLSFLMNANLPLFSLKFKSFGIKENAIKYMFLIASILMIIMLQYLAVPLIILLYVLLSIVHNNMTLQKG